MCLPDKNMSLSVEERADVSFQMSDESEMFSEITSLYDIGVLVFLNATNYSRTDGKSGGAEGDVPELESLKFDIKS